MTKEKSIKITDEELMREKAKDAFLQAQAGYDVELDPELADAMGAFEEDAISADEIDADKALRKEMGFDDEQ